MDMINDRVKILRKELGLTLEKFGERLGVSRGAMSNIENGNRNVTEQMIRSICREYNVDYIWLTMGEGDMFNPAPQDRPISFKDRIIGAVAVMSDSEAEQVWDMIQKLFVNKPPCEEE